MNLYCVYAEYAHTYFPLSNLRYTEGTAQYEVRIPMLSILRHTPYIGRYFARGETELCLKYLGLPIILLNKSPIRASACLTTFLSTAIFFSGARGERGGGEREDGVRMDGWMNEYRTPRRGGCGIQGKSIGTILPNFVA